MIQGAILLEMVVTCDREEKKEECNGKKKGENSSPLTSLPVNLPNGDRLQRLRSCQITTVELYMLDYLLASE